MMCSFHQLLTFLFGANENGIDRTALWTGVTALVAITAIVIALCELDSTRKTTRADFAKRFVDSFFTTETREMFTLLMNSCLEFDVLVIKDRAGTEIDNLPYLTINKEIVSQLKGVIGVEHGKVGYSAFEIDDLLLGPLDDIAWYECHGLIDWETIEEMFGYYVQATYQNKEIQKYLNHECNEGKYANYRRLAKRLK